MGMHAGDDDDQILVHTIVETLGKARKQCATRPAMKDGIPLGLLPDELQSCIEHGEEFAPRSPGSPRIALDGAVNLFPGDADGPFMVEFIDAPVQLRSLGIGERDCLRRLFEALPQTLEEIGPFLRAEIVDVESGLAHERSIPL